MALEQTACQKCECTLISRLFCFSCNALQPFPKEIDFFEVMGFPITFEMTKEEIEERYKQLSLELHPDFYGTAPEYEKRLSETASAILNTAYNTLKVTASRAAYMLYLSSKGKKLNQKSLPDGFLQEIFFLQESLDELLNSNNLVAITEMQIELKKRYSQVENRFLPLFKELNTDLENEHILQQLQTQLNAERYLRRLLEKISETDSAFA